MTKNNLLSEKLNYTGISQTPTHLHLCSYNPEGVHDCNGKDIDEMIPHLQPNSINWIQIHGLQNTETVQKICQHFGIDFLVTQDIQNADHLKKTIIICRSSFVSFRERTSCSRSSKKKPKC